MSSTLRLFIREYAADWRENSSFSRTTQAPPEINYNKKIIKESVYMWAWLELLKSFASLVSTPAGLGSTSNPCEAFKEVLNYEKDRRTAWAVAGMALGAAAAAEGIAVSSLLAREGLALWTSGSRLSAAWRGFSSLLGAFGALATVDQIYKLYILAFVPPETQNKTAAQINREILDIIGNLYIIYALGGLPAVKSGSGAATGEAIISQVKSQNNFASFVKTFIEKYSELRRSPYFNAAASLGVFPAINIETFYDSGAVKNLKRLDKQSLYEVDSEFIKENLLNNIDTDGVSEEVTLIAAEMYRDDILKQIEQMCASKISTSDFSKIESLVKQYDELSKMLGL